MIDYHCHLLPGVDDGSQDVAESLAMAAQLLDAGFTRVYCTPHCITDLYDVPNELVRSAVKNLQFALAKANIPLQLEVGMEYYLDDNFCARLHEPITLGDTGVLLFEMPTRGNFDLLRAAVEQIVGCGFTPLLAHPERYQFMVIRGESPNFIQRLWRSTVTNDAHHTRVVHPIVDEIIQLGCLLQGDIGSFSGLYGLDAQIAFNLFLAQGYYHCFGSDGHRKGPLRQILSGLNDETLANECYQKRHCAEFKT